jgi:hypothetical protein
MPSQNGYEITSDSESVEIWLATRLPFEPKGKLLEARNELRAHLRKLVSGPGTILSAVYTSQDDYRFDVENVLIYNVLRSPDSPALGEIEADIQAIEKDIVSMLREEAD